MRVVIWNENCVLAGRAVSDAEIEGYDDPRDCGDWTVYEGTPEELLSDAARLPKMRGRGYDQYYERVARTISEAVYLERPELEPQT